MHPQFGIPNTTPAFVHFLKFSNFMLQFGFFGDLIIEVTYFGMDFIFEST